MDANPWAAIVDMSISKGSTRWIRLISSNNWELLLNDTMGGSIYNLEGIEVFFSNDGQAFGIDPNGIVLWHITTMVSRHPSVLCRPRAGFAGTIG